MRNILRVGFVVFAVLVIFISYNKRVKKAGHEVTVKEEAKEIKQEDREGVIEVRPETELEPELEIKESPREELIEIRPEPEKKPSPLKEPKNIRGFKIESDDMVLGNRDAKIIFVEYFSPTCPHCVVYHRRVFPEIRKKYIETGKIAYVMREFVNNKQDLDASILARCDGGLDSYAKFVQVLLERQDQWVFNKNYREILTNIAGLGGVSAEKYATCLNSSSLVSTVVGNTKLISREPKFMGTPSFFINGKQFTAPYTLDDLSKAIDEALADGV